MAKLIRHSRAGAVIGDDTWQLIRLAEGESAADLPLPDGDLIVPLAVWQARKDELIAGRKRLGVWLGVTEGPEMIADDLHYFLVIGVDFPKFTDGRGYSTARLLRERHHYEGELRAIGDVLPDQLFFMKRCGFDAFALRADHAADAALAGFAVFSDAYQGAVDEPLPAFRRRPT